MRNFLRISAIVATITVIAIIVIALLWAADKFLGTGIVDKLVDFTMIVLSIYLGYWMGSRWQEEQVMGGSINPMSIVGQANSANEAGQDAGKVEFDPLGFASDQPPDTLDNADSTDDDQPLAGQSNWTL